MRLYAICLLSEEIRHFELLNVANTCIFTFCLSRCYVVLLATLCCQRLKLDAFVDINVLAFYAITFYVNFPRSFPLEMHILCQNTKYDDLTTATQRPDGLAVLAVWFEVRTGVVRGTYGT